MLKVGIVGGTGYTGAELLRLIAAHPNAEVAMITSRAEDGVPVDQLFPSLRGVCDLAFSVPDGRPVFLRRCVLRDPPQRCNAVGAGIACRRYSGN